MGRMEGVKIQGTVNVYRKMKGGSVTHGLRHEGTPLFPLTRRECRTLIHWQRMDESCLNIACINMHEAHWLLELCGFFGFGHLLSYKSTFRY